MALPYWHLTFGKKGGIDNNAIGPNSQSFNLNNKRG